MADGKKSHDWDLFSKLICYVASPYMKKGKALKISDVHPYHRKQPASRTLTAEEFRDWLYGD